MHEPLDRIGPAGPAPRLAAPHRPRPYVVRGYQPGGRWQRILRAIERHPLTLSELLREIGDGRYSHKVERSKIFNALDAMTQQGLVVRLSAHEGFIASAHGVRTLREEAAAA